MRAQRVREAESRIEMQVAKWTAEGTVKGFENPSTLCVWAYVSCRRYVSILQSAWECTRESRWHRGKDLDLPSLTE